MSLNYVPTPGRGGIDGIKAEGIKLFSPTRRVCSRSLMSSSVSSFRSLGTKDQNVCTALVYCFTLWEERKRGTEVKTGTAYSIKTSYFVLRVYSVLSWPDSTCQNLKLAYMTFTEKTWNLRTWLLQRKETWEVSQNVNLWILEQLESV